MLLSHDISDVQSRGAKKHTYFYDFKFSELSSNLWYKS